MRTIILNDQGGGVMNASYDVVGTLRAEDHGHPPLVLVLEHHPNDSRIKIKEDGVCQSLTSRMGTGGGNVPLVLIYETTRNGIEQQLSGRDDRG